MSKRKVTSYSEEFKKSSAKLAAEAQQAISKTATDLGINVSTLHGWVNKYYPQATSTSPVTADPNLLEEIKRLEKELLRVKQERDILKKATAYFAREHQ